MTRSVAYWLVAALFVTTCVRTCSAADDETWRLHRSARQRRAANEPGPHKGGGSTVGHSFFSKTPGLRLVFRKRVLKPGSGIGYHVQQEDEIYYVLSGRGVMTLDGKSVDVVPGTAILTRTGSSHGLKQAGTETW